MDDMRDIILYISHTLCNPEAANKLANEMVDAANRLAEFPYIHTVFHPIKPLEHEYRMLYVHNYTMFYWVNEKEKQVNFYRVIYSGRDYNRHL